MISNKTVKDIYKTSVGNLLRNATGQHKGRLPTQFSRGESPHLWEGQHNAGCNRHLTVFKEYEIIPEYCFSCYKITFEPRNVIELFKLMVVLEQLKLPKDNTRKCMVEGRTDVPGFYKGFIYCRDYEDSLNILKNVKKIVEKEIAQDFPVRVKRGCSEYAVSYPEYANLEPEEGVMRYGDDWKEVETRAEKELRFNVNTSMLDSHNQEGYTKRDAMIMLSWVKYAATIGDDSYLKLTEREVPRMSGLKRPFIFSSQIT
jgi:hypothetical protein